MNLLNKVGELIDRYIHGTRMAETRYSQAVGEFHRPSTQEYLFASSTLHPEEAHL